MSKVRHTSCHCRWNSWQHRTSLFNWLCVNLLQSNKNPQRTWIYNFKSISFVSHLVTLHIIDIFMYKWYILLYDVIIPSVMKHRPCYRKFPITMFQIGHIVHILSKDKGSMYSITLYSNGLSKVVCGSLVFLIWYCYLKWSCCFLILFFLSWKSKKVAVVICNQALLVLIHRYEKYEHTLSTIYSRCIFAAL